MTYSGIVKGKTIELEVAIPLPDGQPVTVSVEPVSEEPPLGSPARIRKVLDELPRLDPADVDALEAAIEQGKLPVRHEGIFDGEDAR